ncbi:non-canonical purine NTP pyrophosphatase [Candidatus Gottesmanbacteria bacterium]|nr:non-canonical purine NTP pyrophosphatase [Candidatus Gottesmanbacteria bacterium]
MNILLIATTNPGKLLEIKQFLSDLPIELVGLEDVGITENVEETGKTFEENAVLKATYYAKKSGLLTLADDGGFEIDVLHGEPGVKSHRWIDSNRESTDEELIAFTFERLKDVPEGKRGAQLRLVLALVAPNGDLLATAEEKIHGIIPLTPATVRHAGFPYRSILFLPELGKFYDHLTFTKEETEEYNHRKRALEKLKPMIKKYVGY